MNQQGISKWSIEARAFSIKYTTCTHNFWVLTNSHHIIDQIHGLAVDPITGAAKAMGNSHHLLQAIQNASIAWSLQPGQPTIPCASGQETEIKHRWHTAITAIPEINALKLQYPNLWQHGYKKNSNTIFNTIGQIMGFPQPALLLPTRAPGINLVISQDIIDHYRYKHDP